VPRLPGDWRLFPTRMSQPWLRRILFSRRARRGWALALWLLVAIVVALALMPWSIEMPSSGWDKADHVAAFAALAFVGLFAWRDHPAVHRRVLFGLLALGVAIELAQMLVPGRMADWRDVIADTAGVMLGLSLATWLSSRMDRRAQQRPDDTA
jgi:VanZ family protein